MDKTHIKQKVILSAVAGMILIPGRVLDVSAAGKTGEQPFVQASGIESVLEKCYETEVKENINLYLVPTEEGEYLNMAFSDTGDYTYIRSAPDESSDWVGKLYQDSAAQVLEYARHAEEYGIRYSGMVIEDYSDNLEGPFSSNMNTQRFQYFGSSLLRLGGEIGLHGYNHIPLCREGFDAGLRSAGSTHRGGRGFQTEVYHGSTPPGSRRSKLFFTEYCFSEVYVFKTGVL